MKGFKFALSLALFLAGPAFLRPALPQAGGEDKIDGLLKTMRQIETGPGAERRTEWNQRNAVRAVGALRTDRALKLLLEFLGDRSLHDWARYEAAVVFRKWRVEAAVEPLIALLKDRTSNPPPRAGAAYALGDLAAGKAVPALVEVLAEPSRELKMGAVYGLGKIGTDEAVAGLARALENGDESIRKLAFPHMIRLRPERRIGLLLAGLKDDGWGAREDAVRGLAETGPPAIPHLLELLKDKDARIRWEAVRTLGKIGSETARGPILTSLQDADWRVRNEAAVVLAGLAPAGAAGPLRDLLNHASADVRLEAAWILGEGKAETALDALIRALADPSSGWAAAMALGRIGSEKAAPPLAALLSNDDVRNRRAAAWALEKIPSARAAASLRAALADPDEEVRARAARALEKIFR